STRWRHCGAGSASGTGAVGSRAAADPARDMCALSGLPCVPMRTEGSVMPCPSPEKCWCPWCGQTTGPFRLVRQNADHAEFECTNCGKRHVRWDGTEDVWLHPGDLDRAIADDGNPSWEEDTTDVI